MADQREKRSFLMPRDPSIDRRFRPCPQKRERLFSEIDEDEEYETCSTIDSAIEEAPIVETGALVYLRLKPVGRPSTAYKIVDNVLVNGPPTESVSTSKNKNNMEKHYQFTQIFDDEVSQCDIYEKCIAEKIESEDSFTVLTYGTSGSGKTFTLLGDDMQPGIIPRSLEHIFTLYKFNLYQFPIMKLVNASVTILDDDMAAKENITSRQMIEQCKNFETNYLRLQHSIQNDHKFEKLSSLDDNVSVLIWVTFVEIYNECVYDLLAPIKAGGGGGGGSGVGESIGGANARKTLKIVCNAGKVFIKGVSSINVKSSLEALKLLRSGLQKVSYASTAINTNSSRSHCIFFVDVLKYYRTGVITETSYKFCDLAGSERIDKSGTMGSRLTEAKQINKSLMILGRCLDAANNMTNLASTSSSLALIPFRESKLTMLLQAALQGREKLAMIVNVTPTEKFYEENLNVLNFASIASNIIFKAPEIKRNQSRYSAFGTTPDNSYIQLLEENTLLKSKIETLHLQQNQQVEALIDENYGLKEEIQRLQYEHQEELLKQEQHLRNKLVDEFQKTSEEHKKSFELRLQREIEMLKRSHKLEVEILKRRHQEELDDLRDELESDDEIINIVENVDENPIEVDFEMQNKENISHNNL